MTTMYSKLPFYQILQEALNWSGLSPSQFSTQSGFPPDRVYRALKDDPDAQKLSLETIEQILNRFPELNGDRFIRRSGPMLLADLCENVKLNVESCVSEVSQNESNTIENLQGLIDAKDKQIDSQDKQIESLLKQIDLLMKMVDK
jgi:hypothetical protein